MELELDIVMFLGGYCEKIHAVLCPADNQLWIIQPTRMITP